MNSTFFHKVELTFWDLIIRLLSESKFIRNIISKISLYIAQNKTISFNMMFGIIAIAGFMSGCLLFIILSLA